MYTTAKSVCTEEGGGAKLPKMETVG